MQDSVDIGRLIDQKRLGFFHWSLVIMAFCIMMLDGFDIGAAAFAAPALIKEFHVGRAELGPLFSASLVAGLFGPAIFGFLSDKIGRKPVIVGGALFFGAFTLLSVTVGSFNQLILLRFIAGIGISGLLPIMVSLVNEYAPRRVRATLVVVCFCGVTLGGGLPGVVSAAYMPIYGWRLLFWIGGLMPIVFGLILWVGLPESLKFLALRPERRDRLVTTLRRIAPEVQVGPQTTFFVGGEARHQTFRVGALFEGRLAWLTPLFWLSNFFSLLVFYFVNQWTPTLLGTAGITPGQAAIATSLFQFGGTVGGFVIMRPLDKWGFFPVPLLFGLGAPVLVAIALAGDSPALVMSLMFLAGFCLLGLQFGNIACETMIYPTSIRAWGVGSNFALGRVGSAIGPLVGGVLIGMKLEPSALFMIAAVPLVLGCLTGLAIMPGYRRQVTGMDAAADEAIAVAE
jgi:MFS transporter, AAHS family, 4-hydroxybenzoate transporter